MRKRIAVGAVVAAVAALGSGFGVAQAAPGGNNPPKSQGAVVQPYYGLDDLLGIDCALVTHKGVAYVDCG